MSNTNSNGGEMTITTTNGKAIRVTSACIRISKSPSCERGVFVETRVHAILPGCRKAALLSSPMLMPGKLYLRPLYGHVLNPGTVSPAVWAEFLGKLPVVADQLTGEVVLTPELEKYAREHELAVTTCPAVCNPA